MDTSQAFLGLIEARPGYGYELKQRYDDYFGAERALKFGQVYAMLARLERDELIVMDGVEEGGGPNRKRYRGLPAGRERVLQWLTQPDEEVTGRSNLFAKVVVSLLLDEDAVRLLALHRSTLLNAMRRLTRAKQGAELLDVLAYDQSLFRVEADLRWIDTTEARLTDLKESLR
ncbi:PadR family transcriptional regulator [Microbacterium gorillae]|uniref:PadR family transcriptional regulator n=1 Tax=Microbacterium gorillae TaxID=1231063 RepID=UPI003D97E7BB